MTPSDESGTWSASEHRPMESVDLGSRGGVGPSAVRCGTGGKSGARAFGSPLRPCRHVGWTIQAQGCPAFAHLALLILQSMTNMQSMTNGCPT